MTVLFDDEGYRTLDVNVVRDQELLVPTPPGGSEQQAAKGR